MDKILTNIHWVVLVVIGMGIFSTYTDHQDQMEKAKADLVAEETSLSTKRADYKNLEAYSKDIDRARADLELARDAIEKMQKQLPSEVSNTENLEILQNIAAALNIKNISLNPGDEVAYDFYLTKNYGFKATGTFLQFLIFFERLTREQRIFNIKSTTLITGTHKQKGRFQMIDADIQIEAFRYNPNYKESSGIEEVESEVGKPAEKPKRKRNAEGSAKAESGDNE